MEYYFECLIIFYLDEEDSARMMRGIFFFDNYKLEYEI